MKKGENMPKKEHSPRVRICVVGAANVGKSAITVRFLTRRFIGEYESNVERSYEGCLEGDNQSIPYHLKDCNSKPETSVYLKWPTCIAVVYSIADVKSFETASQLLEEIRRTNDSNFTTPVIALIGNKSDLKRHRQVPDEEGQILADEYDAVFWEASASDDYTSVFRPISSIITKAFVKSMRKGTWYESHLDEEDMGSLISEMKQPSHVNVTASPVERPSNDGHDIIDSVIDRLRRPWRRQSKGKRESFDNETRSHSSSFSSNYSSSPISSPKSSFSKISSPKSSLSRISPSPSSSRKTLSSPSPRSSSCSSKYPLTPSSSFISSSSSSLTSSRSNTPTSPIPPLHRPTSPQETIEEEIVSEDSTPQIRRRNAIYIRKLVKEPCAPHLLDSKRKSRSFSDLSTLEIIESEIVERDRCSTLPGSITTQTRTGCSQSQRRSSVDTMMKSSLPLQTEIGYEVDSCQSTTSSPSYHAEDKHSTKSMKKRIANMFK